MGNAVIKTLAGLILGGALLMVGTGACAGLQEAKAAYAKKDYKTMLRELKPLVDKDMPEAIFYVGWLFDNGEGTAQNYQMAMEWYTRAAKMGYAPAQNNLGWIYQKGTNTGGYIELSDSSAAFWYSKAAEQGNAVAEFNLGLMYYIGNRVLLRDWKQAASWFLRSAEQGYTMAQNRLGQMYENAQGVDVSLVQADKWYTIAVQTGDEIALKNKKVVEAKMAPDMIEEAQALAQDWLAKHK
jgi:TPR repeat protein